MEGLKKLCAGDNEESKNIKIYKLPNDKTVEEGVYMSQIFTSKMERTAVKEEKVVMLLGYTGVGKTTIINRMINYIFGVSYTDAFRFQLIKTSKSQTKSLRKAYTNTLYIIKIFHMF